MISKFVDFGKFSYIWYNGGYSGIVFNKFSGFAYSGSDKVLYQVNEKYHRLYGPAECFDFYDPDIWYVNSRFLNKFKKGK